MHLTNIKRMKKYHFVTSFNSDSYRNINGLCKNDFYGTQKEYDEILKPYIDSDTYGKVNGTFKYNDAEWLTLHKMTKEQCKSIDDNIKAMEDAGKNGVNQGLNRSNTNKRYWRYL